MKRLGLYLLSIPLLLALTACVDTSRKAYTVGDAGTGSSAVCGDGRIMADERCDDGNAAGGDGCSATCQVESGYSCGGEPSSCAQGVGSCGDGKLAAGEGCDDGNTSAGDGCSASCAQESGWSCQGTPSVCTAQVAATCGDGARAESEGCDDGNTTAGDGCNANCALEDGWYCSGSPSSCYQHGSCGDGTLDRDEICDDGNNTDGDGCTGACEQEIGWSCDRGGACERRTGCGDGIVQDGEGCDDGNLDNADGCSNSCAVTGEDYGPWTCAGTAPSVCTLAKDTCGNGQLDPREGCDDGNSELYDGCVGCVVTLGWRCSGEPSVCSNRYGCGNGVKESGESCDDGNTTAGDGCSASCQVEASVVKAFPGAEGFGTSTPGGRGGKIVKVTTRNWSGPGSLGAALMMTEPRIIVFEVSGVISVPATGSEEFNLGPQQSYVTVAGQTSPGGITLVGETEATVLWSYVDDDAAHRASRERDDQQFHDAVFQHLRFRGHDNSDNVSFSAVHNIVFDHCDFSGAGDEALDITYSHDITVQWSTITNSGYGNTDPESISGGSGSSYGALIAYYPTTNISFHHNLQTNHFRRCGFHFHWEMAHQTPRGGAYFDVRNNVYHNCAMQPLQGDLGGNETKGDAFFNVIGNSLTRGRQDANGALIGVAEEGRVYLDDNIHFREAGEEGGPIAGHPRELTQPVDMAPVSTQARTTARDEVLNKAGAWPRDALNLRTVAEVRAAPGTGSLRNSSATWLSSTEAPPADADGDGMPDSWETAHGLNNSTDDSAGDADGDGYTNIEEYLYDRAQELIGQ